MHYFRKYLALALAGALACLSFNATADVIRTYATETFAGHETFGAQSAKFEAALASWRQDLSSACSSMLGSLTKQGHGFKMSSMLKPGTEAMAC